MGEIGVNRREYLYELRWWEILATVRGYRKRMQPYWEMTRWVAWSSAFCMGGEDIPDMERWVRFPWEVKKKRSISQPSEDEEAELQQKMDEINKKKNGN